MGPETVLTHSLLFNSYSVTSRSVSNRLPRKLAVLRIVVPTPIGPSEVCNVSTIGPFHAASFAGSAALLAGLPRSGAPGTGQPRIPVRTRIAEGLRWLYRHRLLRVVAVLLGVLNFANQMGQAVLVLLATEVLHLWHREAKRDEESSNRKVVLQRAADKTILAAPGFKPGGNAQAAVK